MSNLLHNRITAVKHPTDGQFLQLTQQLRKGAKGKQSLYTPGKALRIQGGWGFQTARKSAYESINIITPTQRPALHSRKHCRYSFFRRRIDDLAIVLQEWLCRRNILMNLSGFEPKTLRSASTNCDNAWGHFKIFSAQNENNSQFYQSSALILHTFSQIFSWLYQASSDSFGEESSIQHSRNIIQ
jgi:hypothetical protein